jgi:Holliday junction resolvasome RuvABC endonuclease subunit
MNIKIVGIDISLSNLGLAVGTYNTDAAKFTVGNLILVSTELDKANRKTVRKNSDDLRRARILQRALAFVVKDADVACVEMPVGSKSARAMASYGMCVGVIASCTVPLIELTPYEVKEAAVGHKQAAKEEMIAWGVVRYPYANWRRHERAGKVNGKGGKELASWKVGDPKSDNEHLADACAAVEAGLKTDEFARMLAMLRLKAA